MSINEYSHALYRIGDDQQTVFVVWYWEDVPDEVGMQAAKQPASTAGAL